MNIIKIRVLNKSNNPPPVYETPLSAGADLRADLSENLTIPPGDKAIIPTGLFVEIPDGFEAQIRPRSGLAAKFGITVLNSPGTIDADFRGELKVILINLSKADFEVKHGDRIAQLVVAPCWHAEWENATELNASKRNEGGFGSTGIN